MRRLFTQVESIQLACLSLSLLLFQLFLKSFFFLFFFSIVEYIFREMCAIVPASSLNLFNEARYNRDRLPWREQLTSDFLILPCFPSVIVKCCSRWMSFIFLLPSSCHLTLYSIAECHFDMIQLQLKINPHFHFL